MIAPFASSPLVGPVNELADRYFFLGVLGGGLLWGSALAAAGERFRFGKRGRSLLAFVALPLFVPAWWATQAWRDERSLWTTAVERQPSSPRAWAALSRVHRLAGDHPAALAAVERAIALDPSYPPALVTRVYNEIAAGDLEKARAHVADADRRGFGDEKGMKRARRCAVLEPSSARACLEK
jgi:tetratricopeptide (TPR) repeat protein